MKKLFLVFLMFIGTLTFAQKEFTLNYNNYGIQLSPSHEYEWGIAQSQIVYNYNDQNKLKLVIPQSNVYYMFDIIGNAKKRTSDGLGFQEITLRDRNGSIAILGLFDDVRYGCVIVFSDSSKIGLYNK